MVSTFRLFVFLSFIPLISCRDDKPVSYIVPAEAPFPAPASEKSGLTWTPPKGWVEKMPSSMRLASFRVGKTGDMSVVVLGPEAGDLLPNVNRWREQLGLSPVGEEALKSLTRSIAPAGRRMTLVDMASATSSQRMLVAMYPAGGRIWFFKLMGAEADVRGARPAFEEFLESLQGL
jgi:hypothetical protein